MPVGNILLLACLSGLFSLLPAHPSWRARLGMCVVFAVVNLVLQSYLSKHFGFFVLVNLLYSMLRGLGMMLRRKAVILDVVMFDPVLVVTLVYRLKGIVSVRYSAYFAPLSLMVLASTLLLQRAHIEYSCLQDENPYLLFSKSDTRKAMFAAILAAILFSGCEFIGFSNRLYLILPLAAVLLLLLKAANQMPKLSSVHAFLLWETALLTILASLFTIQYYFST